jgi:tRNA-splicing ligase RtcB (3'-phosphate/5'-hydroxy nucleic acid ligase)
VRSRKQALRSVNATRPRRDLERDAILVRAASRQALAEEAPEAYKDVDAVVEAAEGAGLSRRVARLAPLGVMKG